MSNLAHQLTETMPRLIDGLLGLDDRQTGAAQLVISTGCSELDSLLSGGIRGGQLTVLAAVPGTGTSLLALGLARRAVFEHETRAVVISPETAQVETLSRVISAEVSLPISRVRRGELDDSQRNKLARQRLHLRNENLVVDAEWECPATTEALLARVERWAHHGAGVIVIDGISQAAPTTRDLVHGLRTLAQQTNTAIVIATEALVPSGRAHQPPRIEDIRDHAAFGDLVDLVITIHRDDVHTVESTRPGEADLEIVRHRFGPTRSVTVAFQGHYSRFADVIGPADARGEST